jgi:hypothetical protein
MVVILAGVACGVGWLVTRNVLASLAGFSVLAILGLRPLTRSGRSGSPIQDERDRAIQQKAWASGYTALWILLVAWGVAVPLAFADSGLVPIALVAPVVWVAWWVVVFVRSVSILVLDSRGV